MSKSLRDLIRAKHEKSRYLFENFMAGGGLSVFVFLTVLFILIFFFAFIVRWIILLIFPDSNSPGNPFEHMWVIFLQMTDPGNMVEDSGTPPWIRFAAMLAGVMGVVIFSMLIAFITTHLESVMNEIRKGHSKVIETDHTLILGWNERVLDIIRELIVANKNKSDAAVVILADKDKVDMDDEIKAFIPDMKTTRVITRSGKTSSITKLLMVNAHKARSAIILASCSESDPRQERQASDASVPLC